MNNYVIYPNNTFWNLYCNTKDDMFGVHYEHVNNVQYIKLGNVYNPLYFELRKLTGEFPRNSIRIANGDIIRIIS